MRCRETAKKRWDRYHRRKTKATTGAARNKAAEDQPGKKRREGSKEKPRSGKRCQPNRDGKRCVVFPDPKEDGVFAGRDREAAQQEKDVSVDVEGVRWEGKELPVATGAQGRGGRAS